MHKPLSHKSQTKASLAISSYIYIYIFQVGLLNWSTALRNGELGFVTRWFVHWHANHMSLILDISHFFFSFQPVLSNISLKSIWLHLALEKVFIVQFHWNPHTFANNNARLHKQLLPGTRWTQIDFSYLSTTKNTTRNDIIVCCIASSYIAQAMYKGVIWIYMPL